ncbi:MAG: hypothetical protein IJ002_03130 [Clostridia bacterium]|nr:hypothetical protein [Clostridia bacterium]MBQ8836485.1 hypothetical protein [Clostridia bacterium]
MPIPFFEKLVKHKPYPQKLRALSAKGEAGAAPATLPVDEKRIAVWNAALRSYKSRRSVIEDKIRSNEAFWRMRQWKVRDPDGGMQTPSTAWLFTCIQSKLADVMDSYPTANFRPRQKDDVEEAKRLSSIVPVIMAQNNFEQTYREVSEYTLKNGIGIYHVFWDGRKLHGLGDIAIKKMDVLRVFFEPGITDIQDSTYLFVVELVDKNTLYGRYPHARSTVKGKVIEPSRFITDEQVDVQDKIVVVDVYYKVETGGKRILHYCKYADTTCLESTENDPEKYPNGLYDHGLYPFVVQSLYHIEQSLYGTGMVDLGADTQLQIDLMNRAVVENTLMGAKPRFLTTLDADAAETQLADLTRTFIQVPSVSEHNTVPMTTTPLGGNYLEFIQSKIDELKRVTSNHDVNNGAAPSGITAASAISALQETSGKDSRFINKSFYNAYRLLMTQVVELIRQFYDVPRWFRIIPDQAAGASEAFVKFDNSGLKGSPQVTAGGEPIGWRVSEFDIEITAEKANPYRKMEQNELALSFFKLGFFNPQLTDQALACLSMMDFDHKQDVIERIERNGTLIEMLAMYQKLAIGMAKRYGDAEALRVIQQNMMAYGQEIPVGADVDPADAADPEAGTKEAKHVQKARERARSSTEVI